MSGRGPAPKPTDRRAGHSKDAHPVTKIDFVAAQAPDLPGEVDWHPRTVEWWETLRSSPQAQLMMAADWSFMLDTAFLHHQFWSKGHWTLAAEIRLRVAKMGVTPEDRLRLRIQAVTADEADAKRPAPSSRERRGVLHALPAAKASGE